METRIKENPRLPELQKRGGYIYRFRAEYKNISDGRWYPIIDRRYNRTKRQARRTANWLASMSKSKPIAFTIPETTLKILLQDFNNEPN